MAGQLHVLRVFTCDEGEHGNPLGVFLDGGEIAADARQRIAAELAFSETVFVEDARAGLIRIHTPVAEIPFAGHPTVGTAWLLAAEREPVEARRLPAGEAAIRSGDGLTWVEAPAEWCPPFEYVEHLDPGAIDALDPAQATNDAYNWAWADKAAGIVRARGFYPSYAISEDEATGSAALALSVHLRRPIEVRQGAGSVIRARPLGNGRGEVGGRVVLEEVRESSLDARIETSGR